MPIWTKSKLIDWYKSHISYLTFTPILVTTAIIAASIIIGFVSACNVESVQSQAADKQLRENAILVQNAFSSYEQLVWGGVGRVNSGPIDRDAWTAFVSTYRLPERSPATSRLSVSEVVKPEEKEGALNRLGEQFGQPIQILSGSDGVDNIIAYSSPEQATTINNVGFNIWSDTNRRLATQRATDSGRVAMTDQIELILNAKSKQTRQGPAFIMYAPYYAKGAPIETVQQRRDALRGHVFASFQTKKVFEQIFERLGNDRVSVEVSTPNKIKGGSTVVYTSAAKNQSGATLKRHQTIDVFGQSFGFDYEFDRSFLVSSAQLNAPLYTTLFGSLVGLLVGTVTFFFLRGRYHQVLLDKERDVARAKDELLSLASHQLRTPATGVKQYLGMVIQGFVGTITDTQNEMLTKAYKSNERQLRVINDILHLAKLDMGRVVLAKTTFDFAELVVDVIDEQKQEVESNGLKVQKKLLKKAPIYADKHMLRMVIENLLSNAIKYTDPKGKISINLQQKDGDYYLTVQDTGVGVASNDIALLFKQFSRIPNSRSHLVTGTGVGLYLAKHLVLLHDGDVVVESEQGEGSSFIVIIPKNLKNM